MYQDIPEESSRLKNIKSSGPRFQLSSMLRPGLAQFENPPVHRSRADLGARFLTQGRRAKKCWDSGAKFSGEEAGKVWKSKNRRLRRQPIPQRSETNQMPMPPISNCLSRSGSKDLTTEVMREAKVKELLDPGLKLLEQNGWALNNMFFLGE